MKLAIIGAGPSGLAAARRALEYGVEFTVLEKKSELGGVWVYDKGSNQKIFESPVYANLRTNLPVPLMEFRDTKFKPQSELSFPHRSEVLEYLNMYAEKYNLKRQIIFQHEVVNISRLNVGKKWKILIKKKASQSLECEYVNEEKMFDAVFICSGHFNKPYIPDIPGLETFLGFLEHSYNYNDNTPYIGKRVLVVGYATSGKDITNECLSVAAQVIISCSSIIKNAPSGLLFKPKVVSIQKDEVSFSDESTAIVDAIILCTGYVYSYQFLDKSCGIKVLENGRIIWPLYMNVINAYYPTMAFSGLHQKTFIFSLIDLEAEFFMRSLVKKFELPTINVMVDEVNSELRKKRDYPKTYYYLDNVELHVRNLCSRSGISLLPTVLYKMYENNTMGNSKNYQGNRDRKFEVIDEENFKVEPDSPDDLPVYN